MFSVSLSCFGAFEAEGREGSRGRRQLLQRPRGRRDIGRRGLCPCRGIGRLDRGRGMRFWVSKAIITGAGGGLRQRDARAIIVGGRGLSEADTGGS